MRKAVCKHKYLLIKGGKTYCRLCLKEVIKYHYCPYEMVATDIKNRIKKDPKKYRYYKVD